MESAYDAFDRLGYQMLFHQFRTDVKKNEVTLTRQVGPELIEITIRAKRMETIVSALENMPRRRRITHDH